MVNGTSSHDWYFYENFNDAFILTQDKTHLIFTFYSDL